MLVSVIIPLYNCEAFIQETVESVLNQSFTNIEVFVVDDGSKDKSAEIVQKIEDPRLHYVFQENAGVSAARNNGFGRSKGELVAFLDSDDVLAKDCIELKVKRFEEDKELGLVHANMQVVNEHTEPTDLIYSGKEGWILDDLLEWRDTCIPSPSSILVKREVVKAVGGFDTDLSTAADQEFFFRVAAKYKIGKVNKALGLYRIHGNNMHSNIVVMDKDHTLAFKKAKAYGFFKNKAFEKRCFANLYKTIGASYWKNQKARMKGFKLLLKAFFIAPVYFFKLF